MIRCLALAIPILSLQLAAADSTTKSVTWTGWFSDAKCAASRVTPGVKFTPTNPECSKECIEHGAAPVFMSEQAHAIFTVKDYPELIDQLGYHVEVQGSVDEKTGTITIGKVTQLGWDGAACARKPPKKAAKQ